MHKHVLWILISFAQMSVQDWHVCAQGVSMQHQAAQDLQRLQEFPYG